MWMKKAAARRIRRIRKRDLRQLRSHFARLDPLSRRSRFGYTISDRSLDIHAESCVSKDAIVYGCFENGILHGVGELHVTAHDPERREHDGELAFSVESRWRGYGVGRRLIEHILLAARNRQIAHLSALCSADNTAMLTLARRYATHVISNEVGVKIHLSTGRPSMGSRAREAAENGAHLAFAAISQQFRQTVPSPRCLETSWR